MIIIIFCLSYSAELVAWHIPLKRTWSVDSGLLLVPWTKVENSRLQAFSPLAPKLWNFLPQQLHMEAELDKFRRGLEP